MLERENGYDASHSSALREPGQNPAVCPRTVNGDDGHLPNRRCPRCIPTQGALTVRHRARLASPAPAVPALNDHITTPRPRYEAPMKITSHFFLRLLRDHAPSRCIALFALGIAFALPRLAAQSGTAAITGTVANSSTRQFLTEAEVKIAGTNVSVLTNRDGTFTLRDLAPGSYQLEVSYTGLDTEQRTVTLTTGKMAREEFNLTSGIYKLAAFTVAAEVEGNAAAVNQQRKSDVFVQAISADTLGIVPDGNIGEFLRYVPGLQVNFTNADASTVSMRGQDPEATLFTFDGQVPAAAGTPPRSSTGSADASSRAFEFSSATIANIETIEIFKAPPP